MSVARDAVLGNFNGPLCVVWKYGTVNDWQQWRMVNKRFKAVNDKPQILKEWILAAKFYLMTKSIACHRQPKNQCVTCEEIHSIGKAVLTATDLHDKVSATAKTHKARVYAILGAQRENLRQNKTAAYKSLNAMLNPVEKAKIDRDFATREFNLGVQVSVDVYKGNVVEGRIKLVGTAQRETEDKEHSHPRFTMKELRVRDLIERKSNLRVTTAAAPGCPIDVVVRFVDDKFAKEEQELGIHQQLSWNKQIGRYEEEEPVVTQAMKEPAIK